MPLLQGLQTGLQHLMDRRADELQRCFFLHHIAYDWYQTFGIFPFSAEFWSGIST